MLCVIRGLLDLLALVKMEELLMEMKNDIARLPSELAKLPTVSAQLKMDEISIISKLAKTPDTPSVITQAPPTNSGSVGPPPNKVVVVNKPSTSKYTIVSQQPGPQVQLPGQVAGQVAVQTPEGIVMPVYSVATTGTKPAQSVSVVQAATATTVATTSTSQTIAIGVPAYLDSSNVYQMQLVPAVSGQQMMYWQTPAQVTTVAAAPAAATAVPSQLAVVQGSSGQVLQPVQLSVDSAGGSGGATVTLAPAQPSKNPVITID